MEQLVAASVYAASISAFYLAGIMFRDGVAEDSLGAIRFLPPLIVFIAGLGFVFFGYNISQIGA